MCILSLVFYCIFVLRRLFVEILKDLNIFRETDIANYNSRFSKGQYSITFEDKIMKATSNIEMQKSVPEKKLRKNDILYKDPVDSNSFSQRLLQQENELDSITDVESSIERSEKILKPDTNSQAWFPRPTFADTNHQECLDNPTRYFSLNTLIYDKPLHIVEGLSKGISMNNDAVCNENRNISSIRRYNGKPFSEETELNYTVNSSLLKEMESFKLFPSPSRCLKPINAEKAGVYSENPIIPHFEEIESDYIVNSGIFKETKPIESSSIPLRCMRHAEKGPIYGENSVISSLRSNFDKPLSKENQLNNIFNSSVFKEIEPTVSLPSPVSCTEIRDAEIIPASNENPIILSARKNDESPFTEENELNNIFNKSVYKKTETTRLLRTPLCKESKYIERAQGTSSTPGDVTNLPDKYEILNMSNSEFPIKRSFSKTDDSVIAKESTKVTYPQNNWEKYVNERISDWLKKPEVSQDGRITDNLDTKRPHSFPILHLPPFSLQKTDSTEWSKPLHSKEKTPNFIDNNSNKSLTEFSLSLVNWKRTGHDKAFNMPIENNTAKFRNDLQCGLELMKDLITHIRNLMTAANNLPDLDIKIHARVDIINAGMMVWLTINDLELLIIQAMNDMTTNPDAILNLFNRMTPNLSLLSRKIEDFRYTIRAYCSEIEKLL